MRETRGCVRHTAAGDKAPGARIRWGVSVRAGERQSEMEGGREAKERGERERESSARAASTHADTPAPAIARAQNTKQQQPSQVHSEKPGRPLTLHLLLTHLLSISIFLTFSLSLSF